MAVTTADYQKLANQLIDATKQAAQDNIASLNTQNELDNENINNAANAGGTLYSTATGVRQLQNYNQNILPKITAQQQGALNTEISTRSNLLDTQRQIDAQNEAAAQLTKQNKLIQDQTAYYKKLTDQLNSQLPNGGASGSSTSSGGTYTVQPGDNLSTIASKLGTNWQSIFNANKDKISNPSLIYPGMTLKV